MGVYSSCVCTCVHVCVCVRVYYVHTPSFIGMPIPLTSFYLLELGNHSNQSETYSSVQLLSARPRVNVKIYSFSLFYGSYSR